MENPDIVLYCKSRTELHIKGDSLSIVKKKEETMFKIMNIQSFTIKEPGIVSDGIITFSTAQASSVGLNLGLGISLAGGSEYTVFFKDDEFKTALKVKEYINHFKSKTDQSTMPPAGTVVSVVDEIRGLKQLLDEGILTEDEFAAKKRMLLGI